MEGAIAMNKLVACSGGFVCVHPGHTRMFEAAAEHGNVVVILNSDEWVRRKYGYLVQGWEARSEVLLAMKYVYNVIVADDEDNTVCHTLKHIKPDFFANGGDRIPENTPEVRLCHEMGIALLWNMGGKKIDSSSRMLQRAAF
jgi:glycerol-3-phosphate cytidylyltransferase-like family protein